MKNESRNRVTVKPEYIDTVAKLVTDVNNATQILVARQQTDGLSEQSIRRICYGLSLAKKGIRVHPCNNIPGKTMCNLINQKYAHLIAKTELDNLHEKELNKLNLLYAFKDNKNVKDVGKVNDFDKSVEDCAPKVEVKSDIEYLADAIMKLVQVLSEKL